MPEVAARPAAAEPVTESPGLEAESESESEVIGEPIPEVAPEPELAAGCTGGALDMDVVADVCRVAAQAEDMPGADVLSVTLVAPTGLRSGQSADALIRFDNVSDAELSLLIPGMRCERFTVMIEDRRGRRVDEVENPGGLGLCGVTFALRVVLAPGGVLTKRLPVAAIAMRYVDRVDAAGRTFSGLAPAGPIGAGRYTLSVGVPLFEDHTQGAQGRLTLTAPLRIR